MNEEVFNLSVRKFLKSFGLQGQHEIEQAVANALARSAVSGTETLPGKVTLEIPGLKLKVEFKGEIALG
jgi:Family of unknown function (DUF6494)